MDALLDIPEEVDPEWAAVAVVVVIYRASDGVWAARDAFGTEAGEACVDPFTVDQLARELCPL